MELTDEQISTALLLGTEITPEKFEIVPACTWLESLRRKTSMPDLFVYRHRNTGKFGLAQWSVKPKVFGQGVAVATEICLFSGPPGQNPPDLPDMEWLLWRCKPAEEMMDERKRKRFQEYSAKQSELFDRKSALDDMTSILRKRGLDEAADKLTLEDVPEDGPELDQMREILRWAMQGKIISTG